MRIAFVGPFGFHPNKTMRSRALSLAKGLVEQRQQVKLFMPPWQTPEEADQEWVEEGVKIRYVSLDGGILGITRRLIREVNAWQADVVHTFKPKAYSGLVAWWLWYFQRGQTRLFTDTDDWEGSGGWNDRAPYSPLQKRFFAWQERWGLRHCAGLTVASRTLQSLAWAQGIAPQKVIYLPNGPGIEPGRPGEDRRAALKLGDRPTVLLYSRLFEFDTERLVAILARVKTAVPHLAILSVGSGLYEQEETALQNQLRQAGLSEALFNLGWVAEDALPQTLACADVALYLMEDNLLNRTKCPVKVADMMAIGLPIVAEAVGQVSEYIQAGQSGLLRPTGDVAGIAADIIRLLQDKQACQRLGQAAQSRIEQQFAWSRLAGRLADLYHTAT